MKHTSSSKNNTRNDNGISSIYGGDNDSLENLQERKTSLIIDGKNKNKKKIINDSKYEKLFGFAQDDKENV